MFKRYKEPVDIPTMQPPRRALPAFPERQIISPLPPPSPPDAGVALLALTVVPSAVLAESKFLSLETGMEAGHLVVELVKAYLGEEWQKLFIEKARKGGIEKVPL